MMIKTLRTTCLRTRPLYRYLTTAELRPYTMPEHASPARESMPKIPMHPNSQAASTASPKQQQPKTSPPTITTHSPLSPKSQAQSEPRIQAQSAAQLLAQSSPLLQSQPVPNSSAPALASTQVKKKFARRPRKAVLIITPRATDRLKEIQSDSGNFIKVSVVAKGCAGGAYKLEYVPKAARFDEVVEQDGVRVLVDSMSLMKIIGSEMDFVDDVLSSRFTFNNPNVVSTCGCEESFATKEDEERLLGASGKF